ncbi:MAG: hypothetical protein QHG99_00710 [Methanomicrobiales archaeon]|nr:hypothetical protein [Methanomicrobiales archaeon]
MTGRDGRDAIRVKPQILKAIESMEANGLLSVVRENRDRGVPILLTHLKMEFEKTQDEKYRMAYEWIMKYRDQFLWGLRDGFLAG